MDKQSVETFTVEGFVEGDWHRTILCNERDMAICGAGSLVVSGAYDFVRIMLHNVAPDVDRELIRIDRNGPVSQYSLGEGSKLVLTKNVSATVLNGKDNRSVRVWRLVFGFSIAAVLLVLGVVFGNWAVKII